MDEDKSKSQTQEDEQVEDSATATATDDQDQVEETQDDSQEEDSQEETTEDSTEETEEQDEENSEEDEPAPSPRQNKAIERLTKKLAEAGRQNRQPELTKEEQRIIDDGDYDTDELNKKFSDYGSEREQKGYAQALVEAQESIGFNTRLEIDAPKVAQKYEILNQNSDKFDPGRAALVNELYLSSVGYDRQTGRVQRPDLRYEDFADAIMEFGNRTAAAENVDSQRNTARQSAQTGVRPNNVAKKTYQGGDPRKMSDDQLTSTINDMLGIKPR